MTLPKGVSKTRSGGKRKASSVSFNYFLASCIGLYFHLPVTIKIIYIMTAEKSGAILPLMI